MNEQRAILLIEKPFRVKRCKYCGGPVQSRRTGRCNACHAAYMRDHRKKTPMTPAQRYKDSARSYAGVYKRRGHLVPKPCKCGSTKVQMHHHDYSKPLEVEWLCGPCHMAEHAGEKRPNARRPTTDRLKAGSA